MDSLQQQLNEEFNAIARRQKLAMVTLITLILILIGLNLWRIYMVDQKLNAMRERAESCETGSYPMTGVAIGSDYNEQ